MRLVFSAIVLSVFLGSCTETETLKTVPYARVYFSLDLRGRDNSLNNIYTLMTFTAARSAGESVGVGGLLVFNTGTDGSGMPTFAVYDLCCPYEDNALVRVETHEASSPDFDKAHCTRCGTAYSLFGGYPISGKSTEKLQSYRITAQQPYTGRFIISN
jgi:hypothetical protein